MNTYEVENRNEHLERFEWDEVWWELANRPGMSRVLYIGDSISVGTRRRATAAAENSLLFDGVATSKAVDNPYFPETIRLFARQQSERCAVLFNNGLHGAHLEDQTSYKQAYESLLNFILKEFENTPVFLVLSTGVSNEDRNNRVIARNKAVLELAAKYQLPVIDLYSVVDAHRELISPDGVHLVPEGYELLAKEIVTQVKKVLEIDG